MKHSNNLPQSIIDNYEQNVFVNISYRLYAIYIVSHKRPF